MTESRVEAVARALAIFVEDDPLNVRASPEQVAQAAIEANDAWLAECGAFRAIYTCTGCGDEFDLTMASVMPCGQCDKGTRLLRLEEIKLPAKPTPEDTDR